MAAIFFLFVGLFIPVAALGAQEKEEEETLLKDDLEDGKYTVMVYLWNATMDTESMGNAAMNHEALLTVKNGIYQMEITTHPMTVGTITACLESLQIKQPDGTYHEAEITARNNEGKKPSAFSFLLPSKEEYIDVLIDPKVDIMAGQAIEARLKTDWSTLAKASEDAVVKEDTTNAVVSTPQPEQEKKQSTNKKKKTSSAKKKTSSTKKSSEKKKSQASTASVADELEELLLDETDEGEQENIVEDDMEIEQLKEAEQPIETETPEQIKAAPAGQENTRGSEGWSSQEGIDRESVLLMFILGASVIVSGFLVTVSLAAIFLFIKKEQESRRNVESAEK